MRVPSVLIGALLVPYVSAQQPAGTEMFVNYPGLSDGCKKALATNVTCSSLLPVVALSNSILTSDEVSELCVEDCYTSLQSARKTIAASCTAATDVVVIDNVAYPATFFADSYLLTYQVSCLKDSNGDFCDPQLQSWPDNFDALNSTYQCSDCWLGALSLQLGNPLGYDEGLESNFQALTSSCQATGYGYTAPTVYAVNATTTAANTATSTPTDTVTQTCAAYYTVQSDDDCYSVAKAHSVSTYGLLEANNLDLYCANFAAAVNSTLCIPPPCDTYTWHAWDDCNSVAAQHSGVTLPQFFAWNPMFNPLCLNGPMFNGYEICVSPPGGYLNHTTDANSNQTSAGEGGGTSAVPAPTNTLEGTNRNCSQWYTVIKGDTCAAVSIAQSISLDDFYFLNPDINTDCTNLQLGMAYCVQPVGSITTYPNYTLTGVLPITVTTASFSSVNTAIPTATSDPGFIYTPAPLMPTASGTVSGCYEYGNPDNYTTLCRDFVGSYGISFEQLVDWNPSLEEDRYNCTVSLSNSYCVKKDQNSTAPAEWTVSYCYPINATEPSTVPNCNCFNIVDGVGDPADFACDDFVSEYDVSMTDLLEWNPWLATGDCDAALYSGLPETATRAVCIGTGTATGGDTPTNTVSSTATRTTTNTATSIGPTQTDTVSGCREFHTVQDGDTCASIETTYDITLAQFYAWNPSIGKTCTNVWLGYAYCVDGPAATVSETSTSTSTKTSSVYPTQTGTASNCNKYHNVVADDSCAKIDEENAIGFDTLYKWNPAIGENCQALQVGTAVCVGVAE